MGAVRARSIRFAGIALNRPILLIDPEGSTALNALIYEYVGGNPASDKLPKAGIEANLEIELDVGDAIAAIVKRAAIDSVDEHGRMIFFSNQVGHTTCA